MSKGVWVKLSGGRRQLVGRTYMSDQLQTKRADEPMVVVVGRGIGRGFRALIAHGFRGLNNAALNPHSTNPPWGCGRLPR